MGWNKEVKKIKKILEHLGTEEEINDFINSDRLRPYIVEKDEDNLIEDFKEYIQDQLDWELYKQTIKDGYN
jgi:hypothetical protein